MTRTLRYFAGAVLLMIVLVGGLYAYRMLMLWGGQTPEGFPLLTPMADASGFEPTSLPGAPILENQSAAGGLTVDFGYKVAGISYSYSLALDFPPGRDAGHAVTTVRHATRGATVESAAVRRWDAPRKAYSVALTDGFDAEAKAPALCIKAVIGPSKTGYDLKDASLCVAQRDATGQCHPATLACGLIR